MARNGIEELIDENGFPRSAPRVGLGVADGALLDRVRAEIDALRADGRPYFLTPDDQRGLDLLRLHLLEAET